MGKLAAELSDYVVITSDNPRTENPQAIINEILAGIPKNLSKNLDVEPDRRKAIGLGINNAQSGDIVLIAGKGHEDYQILGKTKVPFDDRLIAAEFMK
jgi:UDP-N-acetylmuramoyl-L-alanyl-D-glutamate--2,6-diaminopimelate ligase